MRKHLASYRIPGDLLAAATLKAAERGETVTDAVIRGLEVYVQGGEAAGIVPAAPVSAVTVHTVSGWPAGDVEAIEDEPERPACPHPAERVDTDTNICRDCGEDVW